MAVQGLLIRRMVDGRSRFETKRSQVVPGGIPGTRISNGIRMVFSSIKPPLLQTPPFDPTASPWSAVKTTSVERAKPIPDFTGASLFH